MQANNNNPDDPEAQFFENFRGGGVRRDTLVREMNDADQAGVAKIKSDVLCYAMCEGILGAMCLSAITAAKEENPPQVNDYILWFLIVNGTFTLIKLILLYGTIDCRSLKAT